MAVHGYIPCLIWNEVGKQFYPFYAGKSNLSIIIVTLSVRVPSRYLNRGHSVGERARLRIKCGEEISEQGDDPGYKS